jgi:hypothetical protein
MSDEINPGHEGMRAVLRVIGPAIAAVGLVFMLIGLVSFFSAFGGGEFPQYFWCIFVGMPLLAIGMTITKFAFLGAAARYLAGETAPVGKDVTNYMVAGTKDSIRDVATAVGEGFAAAGRGSAAARLIVCPKCGVENEATANFCDRCGAAVGAKKKCAKCGDLNDADARFCDKCGAPA